MKIKSLYDIDSVRLYLSRIGAEPVSLRTAVIRETHGSYWKDIANIKFARDGKVTAPDHLMPDDSEAAKIAADCSAITWPEIKPTPKWINPPEAIKSADPEDVFEFRDVAGNIVMVQVRMEKKGEKSYIPYTFWDDGEYRIMEPDGSLPIWGIDQIKDNTTVFIHEGAKAARRVSRMVKADTPKAKEELARHPWGEELSGAAHIGWIGGALSPYRTDWSSLMKLGIKRAYIVSDNDQPGIQSVPRIAQKLRVPTYHIQFTQEWPASFDLADDFPKSMFKKIDGVEHYIGPSWRSCVHPATWATDQIPNPKGKPTTVIRDNFRDMWAFVEEAEIFVCIDMPEIVRSEAVMNKMLASFSHSNQTSTLMVRNYRGRSTKLCYRPDVKGRIVTDRTTSAINLHTPTMIKSVKGDPAPFIEYMEYLFPIKDELKEMLRWCATLIAKPENRMEYGVLLVSETQGIGKTTLGLNILSPLVGDQNAGSPGESDVVDSPFNGWIASKRLVYIGEIYSGHSWKAYNKLKSYITDKEIEINLKFQRPYKVENWAHIFACSNSKRALKMEDDDRRWLYPEVNEKRWPSKKFKEFHTWLQSGGLGIIKYWAEGYGDYVYPGERAPMTERKKELISESRTDAQKEVADLASMIIERDDPIVIGMKSVEAWVRSISQGKVYDTDYDLRKTMKEVGAIIFKKRIKFNGRLQYVIMNPAAFALGADIDDGAFLVELRKHIKEPNEILTTTM